MAVLRVILRIILSILLVFLIAALPDLILPGAAGIRLEAGAVAEDLGGYFRSIVRGEVLHYTALQTHRSLAEDGPRYLRISGFYLVISGFAGLSAGLVLGMFLSARKVSPAKGFLGFLGKIPDFILIMILQIVVVNITVATGFRIARIGSVAGHYPVLLPLISLSLYPAIYLMRMVSLRAYTLRCEDFVLFGKARGLSRRALVLGHVVPGVIPAVRGDLPRLTGMMLGSLFVVERLFALGGVTRALFSYGFYGIVRGLGYQYNLVVNCIFLCVILYGVLYLLLSLFLSLIEWAVKNVR